MDCKGAGAHSFLTLDAPVVFLDDPAATRRSCTARQGSRRLDGTGCMYRIDATLLTSRTHTVEVAGVEVGRITPEDIANGQPNPPALHFGPT
jgi:hypothetical protein